MTPPYVLHKTKRDLHICWADTKGVEHYEFLWGAKPGNYSHTRELTRPCTKIRIDRRKDEYGFVVRSVNQCGAGGFSPALLVNLYYDEESDENKYTSTTEVNGLPKQVPHEHRNRLTTAPVVKDEEYLIKLEYDESEDEEDGFNEESDSECPKPSTQFSPSCNVVAGRANVEWYPEDLYG